MCHYVFDLESTSVHFLLYCPTLVTLRVTERQKLLKNTVSTLTNIINIFLIRPSMEPPILKS